jgi:hypothetical protein
VIQAIDLEEDRFGFEPEVTAKIAARREWRVYEMGISYRGQTYAEGKIGWRDGLRAVWCILKYSPPGARVRRLRHTVVRGRPRAAFAPADRYRPDEAASPAGDGVSPVVAADRDASTPMASDRR